MIEYDETEFQDGLTAQSLKRIAFLFGEDVEEVSRILDPMVVPIHVEPDTVPLLRSPLLPIQKRG